MILPGHSHWDTGAVNSKHGLKEYDIVLEVAKELFAKEDFDQHDIVFKNRNKSYSKLPGEVNSWNPDLVIELHLNSASDTKIQGTEVLYAKGSTKSQSYAQLFQEELLKEFNLTDRKIKSRTKEDRGAHLLFGTKAPCIIVEAYFITGISEEQSKSKSWLVGKYVNAIYNALKRL